MSAAEKFEVTYLDDSANRYRVPKKQWKRWGKTARRVFNHVYSAMRGNCRVYNHPGAAVNVNHWQTVCWNAAWTAAEAVRDL